jgi:hypothetical protein
MPDLTLNEKVKRACHVLALDDERNTFHPVLWDEVDEPQDESHIDDERITQVWFAGMHSNVGGGYADDALSAVSLKWMTTQLVGRKEHRLEFVDALLKHYTAKADLLGRVYDSRSGLKAYYRYNPRKIEWLTNGQEHERAVFGGERPSLATKVTIRRPKIHESVFTRMSAAPEAYAPIVFPANYAIVMEDGRIVDGDQNPFEKPEAVPFRLKAQERVWDFVWYRRVVYYAAAAGTVLLLLRPFRDRADAALADPNGGTAGRIVSGIGEWLPSLAQPWIEYFTARPWELFAGLAFLFVMQKAGADLQARICQGMRGIWLKVIPPVTGEHENLEPHKSALLSIRSNELYQGVYAVLRRKVMPALFGISTLVWLAGAANRAAFEAFNMAGAMCPDASVTTVLAVGDSLTRPFESATFCANTGIGLEANGRYRLVFRPLEGDAAATQRSRKPWSDDTVVVRSAAGFTGRSDGLTLLQRFLFTAFVPFRRVWTSDWFVPIARIGEQGLSQYGIEKDDTTITAGISGELFLFVNDAILPINVMPLAFGGDAYYANNNGSAEVTVTRLSVPEVQ